MFSQIKRKSFKIFHCLISHKIIQQLANSLKLIWVEPKVYLSYFNYLQTRVNFSQQANQDFPSTFASQSSSFLNVTFLLIVFISFVLLKQKNWKMNEYECCFQYLSIFIYLFLRFWAFLCFLSACEDLIKAARESWCSGMRIRWRGIGCQTTIIFLYLHSFLPYLALCAYLGSGCSPISSA